MARNQPPTRSRSISTRPSASASAEPTRPNSRYQSTGTRYTHLAPHEIHISRTKILKKWKPLPLPTQDRIRQVLLDVRDESKARRRKALPKPKNGNTKKTEVNLNGERNDEGQKIMGTVLADEDWEGAIDELVEKLISRLPRMPFPPQRSHPSTHVKASVKSTAASADLDFSLERILERTSALRATLSSNNQSIKLLKAQIKREEQALRRDRGESKTLEEGVKRGREVEERQKRSLHTVARDVNGGNEQKGNGGRVPGSSRMTDDHDEDMMDTLISTAARTRQNKTLIALTNEAIEKDDDLGTLVKQLRSHLGSMQSNVAGLKDLRHSIGSAESVITRLNAKALETRNM